MFQCEYELKCGYTDNGLQGQDVFPIPQLLSLTTISNDNQLCQYDVGFGFQVIKLII